MNIGSLIEVRSFPAVVQAADIAALRQSPESTKAADFIGGYLGFDERSRHALATTVRSLAQDQNGGAFFVNGVFGSGKSHLLGLLTLLADGSGHSAFAQTHPHLAPLLQAFKPRLVVHFSLDNYDAANFSLEEIFWREVKAEWTRRGLPANDLVLPTVGSRGEAFMALEEALVAHGLHGLVVSIDELSLFLSAKEHRALQGDAAFLQFLGQRSRRSPLWIFAALQKTVEDIGELEAYSLSQIRDRFTTLPLSLAHIPSLIEHRLIINKDAAAVHRLCHESFEALARALPRLDFGRAEWEQLYPFYPATVALLEQVVSRFFSRTRSAVLFCAGAIRPDQDATQRILPDALFAYLEPEFETHPDLRPLATVWSNWCESSVELAVDQHEVGALRRLMQGLLLYKIAGIAPTVTQVANAVALDAGLPGDGNYQYAQMLLEKLRTRGDYVAVERHEGEFADRYTVDLGTRVGEMARRFTKNVMSTLPADDARIARYVAGCCRDETFPLAALDGVRSFPIMWRNAPRTMAVALWSGDAVAPALMNRMASLGQPGNAEDAVLLLVPPFAQAEEAARRCCREAAAASADARWRAALILWTPRRPTRDEWELAREATAQHLLEGDPQLLDNRRGRAILQHLKTDAPQREATLARLGARLLREGQITTAAGATIDAADLATGDSWNLTLEAVAEFALPHLFPRFESVAPRLRVLTTSNSEALCLDILRRPVESPFFAPSLERAARAVAEPLGVAQQSQGRWRIEPPRDDLAHAIDTLVTDAGAPLSTVEAALAKSEWGLRPEQTEVAVCALLRTGHLAAFDARSQALSPAQIGMPLRRAVHTLRRGQLLDMAAWSRVQALVALLTTEQLEAVSFAEQERARALLATWCENAVAETELAQARLHQLRRLLHHTLAQWPRTQATWEEIEKLLLALKSEGSTIEVLQQAATLDLDTLRPALATWRGVLDRLENRHAALLSIHTFLTHAELAVPPEMQETRTAILARFDAGEELLEDEEIAEAAQQWRAAYAATYQEWHSAQHAPARFASYRRLAASDAARALEKLETLTARPFEQGRALRAALATELAKGCARDGTLRGDDPVCPECRLRWGERLKLRDPRELEALVAQGLAALQATLREDNVRHYLARRAADGALLEWNGVAETLLPLLTDEALHDLDDALRPRRCVSRSWSRLQESLTDCRTRDDYLTAFRVWLDDGENLTDEDEIVLE
ncbi:MAG: FUSC family protein [Armatimonadota bacterium]|nr:FUSC family protein [Armatimonadota bacterium]